MCVRMHTQQSTVTIAAEDIGHIGPASDAVMIRRRIQMHTQQSTVTIAAGSARTFFIVSSMCLGVCRALRGRFSVPATCHLDSSSFLLISCSAWTFFIVSSMCLGVCRALRGRFSVPATCHLDSSSFCSFHAVQCTDVFHHVVNVLGRLSCLAWSLLCACHLPS